MKIEIDKGSGFCFGIYKNLRALRESNGECQHNWFKAWEFVAQDIEAVWSDLYEHGMCMNLQVKDAPQVFTFTVGVNVEPSIFADGKFYSVLGQDAENNVQLKAEEGLLAAGQAYVFVPGESLAGESKAFFYPAAESFEEFVPTHTALEAVNGLFPVFEKTAVPAGAVNSAYVTKDVVTALQARVALTMHDYETALLKAKTLIDSGTYTLMSDAAAYAKGWKDDNLTETIWRIAMTGPDDYGNTYGYFIYNTTGEDGNDDPQYIPEDWVLDLYDQENDIRYGAYFDEREVSVRITGTITLFVKYPGNPLLYSKVSNYAHMPKVFRISEMYLIAAEAAYNIGGQDAVACKYLNDLRAKRIKGYEAQNYNGAALRNEIRDERTRELYGEGFRLNDLKRWHIGFTRSAGQDPSLLQQGENYAVCTREADDPYFLWPIPEDEIQANPQMKNEQNEAYKR